MSDDGVVTGVVPGVAIVEVSFNGIVREISVDVSASAMASGSVSVSGDPTLRVGGTRTLYADVFDEHGNRIDAPVTWDVFHDGDVPGYVTVADSSGSRIQLRARNDISLIGQVFEVRATDMYGNSGMMGIEVISLV